MQGVNRLFVLHANLFNSQLNNLKSRIKNGIEVTLNLSSHLTGKSNDETNFPQKLLLIDAQVLKIHNDFVNGSSADKNFSKTQLSMMIQSIEFLVNYL